MVLSLIEMRKRSDEFIDEYKDVSDEHSFAQQFWRDFLNIFDINWREVVVYEHAVEKINGNTGHIDCFWEGKLLIEHKSRGKNLDKAYKQALDYFTNLSADEKPRYIIVSDFERIRLIDLYVGKRTEIQLTELTDNIQLFNFIYEPENKKHETQKELDIEASELMGKLYESLENDGYTGYDLELLLVRLLFCVYAEDTGIFDQFQFNDYLFEENDVAKIGTNLQLLFRILNQPEDERQSSISDELKAFPYVNGKLFETPIVPPIFDGTMVNNLKKICNFDWSKISPAIFGSLFQTIMDEELRRELGAHYTSEENILKVVNSLFMNDLWEEFYQAKGVIWKLEALWDKIGKLEFFDPACGCGNFLIVAYKELRLLEFEILSLLLEGDNNQVRFDSKSLSKIKLSHFHGIEIEEFPSLIAKVSMWLIQHQLDLKYETLDIHENNLPLNSSVNIYNENALTIDWKDIVTPSNNLFILGNPPFAGKQEQTEKQKNEMNSVFKGFKKIGNLDYVSAWYKKSAEYIQGTTIEVGFVSTNSICQGEQVSILWDKLKNDYGIVFNFAHQSFKWSNEARNNAKVIVIIIGFSCKEREKKYLFKYFEDSKNPRKFEVNNINSYLLDEKEVIITSRTRPISDVPEIKLGNMANDKGNLILNEKERLELISKYPILKDYIKPFIGGKEFIKGIKRYCLWVYGDDTAIIELNKIPEVKRRFDNVKKHRESSSREQTRELAKYPSLFAEIRQPNHNFIVIPLNTSANREYIPMGILGPEIIVSNLISFVDSDDLFIFGILTSSMHMAWMRVIGGRLGDQYRYSNNVIYNNFPFPKNVSENSRNAIINKVNKIFNLRNDYDYTLEDLYNPDNMPYPLKKAHLELDKLVDKLYANKSFSNDEDRVKLLFDLYLDYTSD